MGSLFSYPLRYGLAARRQPRYVERGGTQDIKNPFRLRDVAIDAFAFAADYAALTRLVDRDINEVLRGGERRRPLGCVLPSVRAVPLAPLAILACAQTARIEVPKVGYIPEVDVAFWVPVLLLAKVGPLRLPWKIAFYQPYLFVDSGQAMATGRETYGYHKMLGDFDLPSDPARPSAIEVRAVAWERYGEGEPASQKRVFRLRETSGAAPDATALSGVEDTLRAALSGLTGGSTRLGVPAINRVIDLLELLDLTRVEQVFLKQFRSIEDPSRAAYQAVTKTGTPLRHFHRGGLLHGSFELELSDLASLPIRQELGLGEGPLHPITAGYCVIDFDLGAGTTLGRG